MPSVVPLSRPHRPAPPPPGTYLEEFVLPLGLLACTLAAVVLLYPFNSLLLSALAVVFTYSVAVPFHRFKAALAAFALPFGTFGEYLCCQYRLWVYARPTFWGLPVWLPLIWPILMISFWQIARCLEGALERRLPPRAAARLEILLKILILAYTAAAFLLIHVVIAAIFAAFLLLMLFFARSRFHWIFFAVAAVCGSVGEVLCIRAGVWYYTAPMFRETGFPLSLPLAWGLSANIIWMMARLVARERGAAPAARAPA